MFVCAVTLELSVTGYSSGVSGIAFGADCFRFRSVDLRTPACLGPDSPLEVSFVATTATSPEDTIEVMGAVTSTIFGLSAFALLIIFGFREIITSRKREMV